MILIASHQKDLAMKSYLKVTNTTPLAVLDMDPLFLDTETSGGSNPEVIEICVMDVSGSVLLDTRIKPQGKIDFYARKVHGISDSDLQYAPTWPAIAGDVKRLLRNRVAVAFNASFDARVVAGTDARHSFEAPGCAWCCAMMDLHGRKIKLSELARNLGVEPPHGSPHSARFDAELMRRAVLAMAKDEAKTTLGTATYTHADLDGMLLTEWVRATDKIWERFSSAFERAIGGGSCDLALLRTDWDVVKELKECGFVVEKLAGNKARGARNVVNALFDGDLVGALYGIEDQEDAVIQALDAGEVPRENFLEHLVRCRDCDDGFTEALIQRLAA